MIRVDSTTQLIKLSPVCDRSISHAGLLWNNVPPECLKFLDPLHTSHSPQPSLSGPFYHFPFNLCQQLLLMVSATRSCSSQGISGQAPSADKLVPFEVEL